MRPTLGASLVLALASSAHSAVRAWQDTATHRLNIENDYLVCSFLPDAGGRLYNCTNKLNQRPLFRASPSGAVAMTFPRGEAGETVPSVESGIRQDKDQAVVWEDGEDRATGLQWSVEFVLREGSAALEQQTTLRNSTAVREPYSWWLKAAVDAATAHAADTNLVTSQKAGAELQVGLFGDPETFQFLLPHQQIRFTEYWMTGRSPSGVTYASPDGILNFERSNAGGKPALVVKLSVTHAMRGARIRISNGKERVLDEAVNLDPSAVVSRTVPASANVAYRFDLIDASGNTLMSFAENESVSAPYTKPELAPIPLTEPDFLVRGNSDELNSRFAMAEEDYRKGLLHYSRSQQLKKALGRLLVSRMRYEEGARQLSEADMPRDAEVGYYTGVALAELGKEEDARKSWAAAAADVLWGPAALMETAASQARSGHSEVAIELAGQAIVKRPLMFSAAKLQVVLLRKAGKMDAAIERAQHWHADPFLRLEQIRLGHADEDLWKFLAADPERMIAIADEYLHLGLYEDALFMLDHANSVASTHVLVAYYRGYCRTKLAQGGGADFHLASSLPLQRVFPYWASSLPVLLTALQANSADASAHFLLGLLYLNGNRLNDGIAELQAARTLRKDIPGLQPVLDQALLAAKTTHVETLAAATIPGARAGSPAGGKASEALQRAAAGDVNSALALFSAANFPRDKQSDDVRHAYIEIQLQRLRSLAGNRRCEEAMAGVETIGDEDKALPFTIYGFGAFMKGARFQYYLGAVEAQCGDLKAARRRWAKVAKMNATPETADFAFPALAAESKTRVQADTEAISKLLTASPPDSKGILLYSQGLLLTSLGDKQKATAAFQEGLQSPDRNMSQYLNQLALREAGGAKQ